MMRALICALACFVAAPARAQTIEDLSWMEGCWYDPNGSRMGEVTEVWLAPPMPALVGFSLTTNRIGRTVFWEQMRIEARAGEPIAFVAMPGGSAPVRFPMIESGPQRVVFENLSHDDPNRIEYAREGDVMTATVTGTRSTQPLVLRYQSEPCGDLLPG